MENLLSTQKQNCFEITEILKNAHKKNLMLMDMAEAFKEKSETAIAMFHLAMILTSNFSDEYKKNLEKELDEITQNFKKDPKKFVSEFLDEDKKEEEAKNPSSVSYVSINTSESH